MLFRSLSSDQSPTAIESLQMIAQPQLEMFGLNIALLIGLLTVGLLGFVLLIALWTGINILRFRREQRHGRRDSDRARRDDKGRPLPPTSPGVCHRCGKASLKVHHLPSGERSCPNCYHATQNKETTPGT